MSFVQILFLIIAAGTLIASIMVVSARNLVRAALWLIGALAGVAVIYILLEAEFLAAVQVVVYIGAITILIIFGVMLTRRVATDPGPRFNRNAWAAALACVLVLGGLLLMFSQVQALSSSAPQLAEGGEALLVDLGRSLVDVDRFVLPFEVASVLLVAALIGAMVVARPARAEDQEGEES